MEMTQEIESQIIDLTHKIRVFDESIKQLKALGANAGVQESRRMRAVLASELSRLTSQISAQQVA
jgi:hypothetical protein